MTPRRRGGMAWDRFGAAAAIVSIVGSGAGAQVARSGEAGVSAGASTSTVLVSMPDGSRRVLSESAWWAAQASMHRPALRVGSDPWRGAPAGEPASAGVDGDASRPMWYSGAVGPRATATMLGEGRAARAPIVVPSSAAAGASRVGEGRVADDEPSVKEVGPGWRPDDRDASTGDNADAFRPEIIAQLRPGSGFTGPTDDPQPQGSPSHLSYNAKVIARWSTIPYQEFDQKIHVGVMAFHIEGVEKVAFAVEGGPWVEVFEEQINPDNGQSEYVVRLDAADLPDGPVEVRAIAYPRIGQPRVLDGTTWTDYRMNNGEVSLIINANSGGTLPRLERHVSPSGNDTTGDGSASAPYATIAKAAATIVIENEAAGRGRNLDGGHIYLAPGDYHYYTNYSTNWGVSRLVTLEPEPGVTRDQVRLVSGAHPGLWRNFVRLRNLTIDASDGVLIYGNGGTIWVDGCEYIGPGRSVGHLGLSFGSYPQFWTNSTVREAQTGYRLATLVRSSVAVNIGEDAFKQVEVVDGCTAENMTLGQSAWHQDVWVHSQGRNVIVRALTAVKNIDAQGLSVFGHDEVAVVGVRIDNTAVDDVKQCLYFADPVHHVLVERSRFVGKCLFRPDLGFVGEDVLLVDNEFPTMPYPGVPTPYPIAGVTIEPEPGG